MNLLTNARDALNARYSGFHEDKVIRVYGFIVCCLNALIAVGYA